MKVSKSINWTRLPKKGGGRWDTLKIFELLSVQDP
jgi:hypothetical protein